MFTPFLVLPRVLAFTAWPCFYRKAWPCFYRKAWPCFILAWPGFTLSLAWPGFTLPGQAKP